MSKLIPRTRAGRAFALGVCIVIAALAVVTLNRTAEAAAYANPFFTTASPSQESAIPSVSGLACVTECTAGKCRVLGGTCPNTKIDARTGEMHYKIAFFRTPGILGDNAFYLTWRSMLSGVTQFGNGWVPSWETTAEYVVVNGSNPNAANGHVVNIRRGETGRIDTFTWTAPPTRRRRTSSTR